MENLVFGTHGRIFIDKYDPLAGFEATSTHNPPSPVNASSPLSPCQWILLGSVGSRIRFFDIILLIPNALFMIFLMNRLGIAHVVLHRVKCPVFKTVYTMVFIVCVIGIIRCFVSMLLTGFFLKECHDDDDLSIKILWLALRCLLLAVELSVIIFGLCAGNLDSRNGVRRVLILTSLCAIAFSSTQAVLEIVREGRKHVYGGEYDLYRHGGLIFWFTSSMFFALMYFTILIIPCTRLRENCVLPERRSFYIYCGLMSLLNLAQSLGCIIFFCGYSAALCVVDVTTFAYYALFAPLVYLTFLADFYNSGSLRPCSDSSDNSSYSYQPTSDNFVRNDPSPINQQPIEFA